MDSFFSLALCPRERERPLSLVVSGDIERLSLWMPLVRMKGFFAGLLKRRVLLLFVEKPPLREMSIKRARRTFFVEGSP